jgi:hypothetical protein
MNLDARDPLDELLRETLRQDAAAAAGSLAELEDRVLESVGERLPRRGFWGSLKAMAAPTRTGRAAQLAFVGATACAFLLLGAFLGGRLPFARQAEPILLGEAATPTAKGVSARASVGSGVLFILPAPNATVVSLVGSFSEWEPMPLTDDDHDGIWTTQVPLPPGRYEYAFIIDGRWFGQDPSADEYVRSFGEYSSVRYIGGGGDGV